MTREQIETEIDRVTLDYEESKLQLDALHVRLGSLTMQNHALGKQLEALHFLKTYYEKEKQDESDT